MKQFSWFTFSGNRRRRAERVAGTKSFVFAITALLSLSCPGICAAGPITKIAKLSPRFNSDVIEVEFQDAVTGGCNTSTLAVTNAAAVNANELTAFLLAAFMAGSNIEVLFGGSCDGGSNWIQTIKLVP